MICRSCGAEVNDNAANCPFCGSAFEKGQEIKHMENLEKLRKDTEELYGDSRRAFKDSFRKHSRIILIIVIVLVAVIILFSVLAAFSKRTTERMRINDVKEEMAFREKYFPELDELHAAGDEDAVLEKINELYMVDGSFALSDWDHYAYYQYYRELVVIEEARKQLANKKADDMVLEDALFSAFQLEYGYEHYYNNGKKMTEDEEAFAEKVHEEARRFISDDLDYNDEEAQKVFEKISYEGYIHYSKCSDFIPELKKHLNIE